MMRFTLVLLCSIFLFFNLSATANTLPSIAADAITIKTPHIKATNVDGPAQKNWEKGAKQTADKVTQVFMDLVNVSNKPHTLIAALSPIAVETQLHQTVNINGQRSMKHVPRITIAAHKDKDLHRGGFHIMLIGLKQKLAAGEDIPITLVFEDGSDMTVYAKVDNGATPPATA